jgi:hypothetical protein
MSKMIMPCLFAFEVFVGKGHLKVMHAECLHEEKQAKE